MAAILQFEAALAGALAEAGIAPAEAAESIARACTEAPGNPAEILASTWESGTPIIAVVESIRTRIDEESHREWVHYGATSQDALDTGRMLQARRAIDLLDGRCTEVALLLGELVVSHRLQPQTARTFLQDARPTTFGARVAGWLSPTLDALTVLRRERESLMVQLGGPSGSLVELGPSATDVVSSLARRLEMRTPLSCWHADRSPIWRLAGAVGALSQTMAKIATDISLLAQSSVAELRVRAGGSSSMPEKRNPIDAIRAVSAAHACHGFASMLTGPPPSQLDRGIGGWHSEWLALPMLFHTAAASVDGVGRCLSEMEVDVEAMTSRVGGDWIVRLAESDPRIIDRVLAKLDRLVGTP